MIDWLTGERRKPPEKRSKKLTRDPQKRYEAAHWGRPSTKTYAQWSHEAEDYGGDLVVMGALHEITVKGLGKLRFNGAAKLTRSGNAVSYTGSLLAYSPRKDERMYNMLSRADKARSKRELIQPQDDWYLLPDVAAEVGGRQARYPSPDLYVQVLGEVTNTVYETLKGAHDDSQGGFAYFTHTLGEESGLRPFLCVGEDGRLWYAGGNYHVPHDGITD